MLLVENRTITQRKIPSGWRDCNTYLDPWNEWTTLPHLTIYLAIYHDLHNSLFPLLSYLFTLSTHLQVFFLITVCHELCQALQVYTSQGSSPTSLFLYWAKVSFTTTSNLGYKFILRTIQNIFPKWYHFKYFKSFSMPLWIEMGFLLLLLYFSPFTFREEKVRNCYGGIFGFGECWQGRHRENNGIEDKTGSLMVVLVWL